MDKQLSHFNSAGRGKMVDVGKKDVSHRRAVASCRVKMLSRTAELIEQGGIGKGDVLAVAQIAGIMAAKRTAEIIPLCHNIQLSGVDIGFNLSVGQGELSIVAEVNCEGRTGVEMEALTAVSVAALTVYDMCKAVDKHMTIDTIRLEEKQGGRSGSFTRMTRGDKNM